MRRSTVVVLALVLGIFAVVLVATAAALSLVGTPAFDEFGWPSIIMLPSISIPSVAVGALIVARTSTQRIGWLMIGIGTAFATALAGGTAVVWSLAQPQPVPGAAVAEWLSGAAWYVMIGLLWPQLLLIFPDGRLPSSRWRGVEVAQLVVVGLIAILVLSPPADPQIAPPFGIPALAAPAAIIEQYAYPLVLGLLLAGALALAVRFRRARGTERQQLKWIAWIGLVIAVGFAGSALLELVSPNLGGVIGTATFFGLILFPIAIGIAVLRYRLYEIDRLISRSIGWAVVTAVLVGTFALLVLGLQAALEPLTGGNTLAIAASTLVVAALFQPVRSRVQAAVDRRFDRSRYDGEQLLAAFGERLRDEVDLAAISADVLTTVDGAVRPATAGLWLRERPEGGGA